ncbi:ion transport peptide isoform X2 [Colletes latitarsis]|uniref:ion transport peptide isoform X2 n=1 Tax=Colletes latitarsis TaxID=2605962 RepID=UPI0040366D41
MGDNDRRRRVTRSRVNFAIRYTMHRQQRLRSPSSSPSSLSLPFSASRSSISTVSLSSTSPSTATSEPITTLTTKTTSPSASTALSSSSSAWSTSPYTWSVQQTSCSRLSSLSGESSIVSVSIPCPRLVSVLAWSVTLLLVSSCIGLTDAGILNGHPLGKRSFIDIQCKGIYDKSIFARLDRICEDCYNLFREPQLHQLCRQSCFGTEYFTSCIQALLLEDEKEKFQEMVEYLGRKK